MKDKKFAKKIKKFKKLYDEICIEQASINMYGCNADILRNAKIKNLHEDGNRLEYCEKYCDEKTQCAFYTLIGCNPLMKKNWNINRR